MPTSDEIAIDQFASHWRIGPICLCTDPVFMEYILENGDPAQKTELAKIQFEASAAIYQTLADASAKSAEIIGQVTDA